MFVQALSLLVNMACKVLQVKADEWVLDLIILRDNVLRVQYFNDLLYHSKLRLVPLEVPVQDADIHSVIRCDLVLQNFHQHFVQVFPESRGLLLSHYLLYQVVH